MKRNIKYRRLVASIYFLLSAFLIISILGIFTYVVLMVVAAFMDITVVPLDVALSAELGFEIITQAGQSVVGTTDSIDLALTITEAPKWFLYYAQVHFVGLFIIGFYGVSQLWFIFRSMHRHLKSDYPFHLRYVLRIRSVALAFFIWSVWQLLFFFITKYAIAEKIFIDGNSVSVRFDVEIIMSLLWGLIVLALAEIFRFGAELKKENELTV